MTKGGHMHITDKEAGLNTPTSKFLTKDELYKGDVDQGHHPKRLNYIFKYKRPIDIPEKEAKLLIGKYESLYHSDQQGNEVIENKPKQEEKIITEVKVSPTKESIQNDMVTSTTGHRSDS